MTKGGYVIVKKKGKVTQVYGSKAKEKRFAKRIDSVIAANTANPMGSLLSRKKAIVPLVQ